MKSKKLQLMGVLIGAFLLLGASAGTAISLDQGNTGNFNFENDSVHVKVTGNGNVPKYTLWAVSDPNTTYSVFFNAIYTANDTNGDGVYNPSEDMKVIGGNPSNPNGVQAALPASKWDFSAIDNRTDGSVHFNISSSNLGKGFEGTTLELRNHIGADANEIKFDVAISGFNISQYADANMLVFVYTLTSSGSSTGTQNADQVSFGDNGYFESAPSAQDDNGNVDVGLWSNSTDSATTVYLAYNAWNGDLVHDPTVGVQASAVNPDDTTSTDSNGPALAEASDKVPISWDMGISKESAGLSTMFATFAALVIPVALYRRK